MVKDMDFAPFSQPRTCPDQSSLIRESEDLRCYYVKNFTDKVGFY